MIPALVVFMSLNFSNFLGDIDIGKIIDSATSGSAMEIAQDSAFTNKTLKFNAGQTIYVRVTADNEGGDKHVLNVRDNNYNFLTGYSMAKNGNQFLVNFPAPSSSGIYSLEANIVSAGSVANFVQTIEVGPTTGSGQVNVKINNQVNTGNQTFTSEESEPTSEVSPDVLGEQPSPASTSTQETQGFFAGIWQEIIKFFKATVNSLQ
ncbi:hypothetical protein A3B51_01000 [Candidatus Curtissbacteria bacterium RIFCSPLOWO2_01_FULL_41_18]|uniref:Uncharacterized protein n=1 Tax=Candidatus Curtissbacteria bacterium RIFCSPLOWO2_01_FULL_41_18 TaxID=1797727 RepID=A0A1F5HNE3_9BACT|nr:MAG: hypothetical protein A3B51_01000 [Candidatus Curtissbacteria bacterium RIFCSPLOWO2_01_FULL_41_18]